MNWLCIQKLRPNECPKQRLSPHRLKWMLSFRPSTSKVVCWPRCLDEENNRNAAGQFVRLQVLGEFNCCAELDGVGITSWHTKADGEPHTIRQQA